MIWKKANKEAGNQKSCRGNKMDFIRKNFFYWLQNWSWILNRSGFSQEKWSEKLKIS